MSPFTHALASWLVAEARPLDRRDRALVLFAGLIPDLDGLTILGGVECYQRWHRTLCHHALGALVCTIAFAFFARRKLVASALVLLSFHLHLLGDLLGSAGPDRSRWPIPYFLPFSDRVVSWSGQWELASWQNVTITVVLLVACFALAVMRGRTMVEALSLRVDAKVVEVFRGWAGFQGIRSP